ncbi:MAG TPA: hypothetical protein DEP53_14105 [Bacteroidetes bacterium]|nr:hypothetical protein [Bacteroidota bacterium]
MGIIKDLILSEFSKGLTASGLVECIHCRHIFWSSLENIYDECTLCKRDNEWCAYKDCSCKYCTDPLYISAPNSFWVQAVFPTCAGGHGNLAQDEEQYAAYYGFSNRWEMAKAALQQLDNPAKLVGGLARVEEEVGKKLENETTEAWLKRLNVSEAGAVFKFLKIVKRCPFTISDIPY